MVCKQDLKVYKYMYSKSFMDFFNLSTTLQNSVLPNFVYFSLQEKVQVD